MKQRIGVLCAVRDDSVVRTLMQELDDGEGCTFCIVRSGTDALRAAQAFAPDILVTDAVLPGLDGPALIDRMRSLLEGRMPSVIGGAMMPFSVNTFARRGVKRLVGVPWNYGELKAALEDAMQELEAVVDWARAQSGVAHARRTLEKLGMRSALRGFEYLSCAAALAALHESRLYAIGERIYAPIAARYQTTPQNVERLIRHAVESTMDAVGAEEIYAFFGNTIDPTRGKPTNAQMIGMLAQRIRGEKSREYKEKSAIESDARGQAAGGRSMAF